MRHIVKVPFTTRRRRLHMGAPVLRSDDLHPFEFDGLEQRGFIGEDEERAPKPAASVDAAGSAARPARPSKWPRRSTAG